MVACEQMLVSPRMWMGVREVHACPHWTQRADAGEDA